MRILRFGAVLVLAFAWSAVARAQSSSFGVGASGGIVDAAEREFKFSDFERSDVNVWAQYAVDRQVFLRATLGRMHVAAYNAGQLVVNDGVTATVPDDVRDRIDYGLIATSYDFVESAWTSGLFAGVGIYRVKPGIPPGDLAFAADKEETVFGFHFGVDAQLTIWRTLGILGRVTCHIPQTNPHRVLITADAGVSYRF
ncbi:MAG TPA: hypothetical protein VFS34_02910 [Thermoanaerobaculia bacterium]|nr:hypothetical protein [Thermoanaerobaculia bacterium]